MIHSLRIGACAALFLLPVIVEAQNYFVGVRGVVITSPAPPAASAGSPYSYQLTAAGGTPPYSWSVTGTLPSGLTLSPGGLLSGTPAGNSMGGYQITVTVNGMYEGEMASASYTITVYPTKAPVYIATIALPNGTVGVFYRQTMQAGGGSPPYMFDAVTLPPNLSISGNGLLSGTPTTAGMYTFTITAADSAGGQASQTYTITIAPPLVLTTTSPLMSGSVGTSFSQTITASGGTLPYSFFVTSGVPPGLMMSLDGVLSGPPAMQGMFTFDIRVVDAQGVTVSGTFQITIAPAPAAVQVSPQALSFTASAGGNAAAPQGISITSTPTSISFSTQFDGGATNAPTPVWLTVKPSGGSTPARLTVTANPGTLPAGTYTARIRVIPNAQAPIDVLVSLTVVAAAPQLGVVPSLLRFVGRLQAPAVLSQVLAVQNTGGGGPLSFSASIVGRSTWLHVIPAAGQAAPNAPVFLEVQVDTHGLPIGSDSDAIRIMSSAGSIDVPVSVWVAEPGPILALSQSGVQLEEGAGGTPLAPQTVQVFNIGDPAQTINWTATVLSGAGAVSFVGSASGTATAAKPGTLTLVANSNVAHGRSALVQVTAPNTLNSPQYLPVVVNRASAAPQFELAPGGLVLTPANNQQIVNVYTDSPTPVPFQAGTDAPGLVSFSPSSGMASAASPGQIMVSGNAAGASPGSNQASLNVAFGAVVLTDSITFIVTPPAATPASAIRAAAGCSPSRLALTHTGMPNNFSVPAGWPATLIVQLNDDCGAPVLNGSVVANFSNGDPPLSLTGDQLTGTYSATWQPGKVASSMTVTAYATAGTLAPATAQLIGGVNPNSVPTPVLTKNGTLNNSNPVSGAALAPGTVAQVFGSGLASQTVSPGVVPLPTNFNGTDMLVGGLDAPLYFLSDGQLDVQIPFELPPNRQYQAIVIANGAFTLPDTIDISPVDPGVTAFPDGTLIAQHPDFSLVDNSHPAKPGETLTIYLAGMGATNPAVATNQQAPGGPFAQAAVQPTVTVDGQGAAISFAGLTPGGIGLYQINFQVPPNARSGNLDVVVTQGGETANTTNMPVAR